MKPSLKDFVNYASPRQRPKLFLFYGICLEAISWLALLVVIMAFAHSIIPAARRFFDREVYHFRLYDLSSYLLILFLALRRVSKKYRFNSRKMLLTDTREPILYLRAFYEESAPKAIYYDKDRTDETLAKVLKNVGPLIAVGKPGDKQQPLGAIRIYFDDDVWQENVKILMSMSKVVVIQAGHSLGLEWEIATAIKCLKPQQLIFTFLSWQDLDEASRHSKFIEFAAQLKRIFNLDLPEIIDDAYFLYFDYAWNPHFASLSRGKRRFYYIASLPIGLLLLPYSQGTFHKLPRFIRLDILWSEPLIETRS